ncbi:set10 [Symbiodinium microadriaticum]|nr:set10 [Symbiodinium microadriaticum]
MVGRGGWVSVWGTSADGSSHCNRFWIEDGSIWSPTWLMFSCQGRSVSSRRWVPTPYLSGQDVSFVEQADVDEAHVLLVPQFEAAAITCRRLLLSPGAARDNANRIPEGWQLRPDLGARVVHSWPRNGDVLIPQLVGRLFQSGVVSFAVAATQRPLGILLFCLVGVSSAYAADAGPATPSMTVEHQPEIPPSAAVLPHNPARMLSPFTGISEEIVITPDTLVDEVRSALSGEEPHWYRDVMPLWPALWQQTAVFVPVPPCGELVCVAVVSPEWQLAVLLPRRADLEWVLAHLRRMTPGAVMSLRPPIAAQVDGQSDRRAVDWRSGDVLMAFQRSDEAGSYGPPVFVSASHVRHAAIWSYDFIVQCELPLLICRVGRHPSGTTMPPPVRWVAAEGAFTGRFRVKFPGRWTPVPWAYSDSITLCQRSDDPEHCTILLERCAGLELSFVCTTVSTLATRYSLARIAQVPPEQVSLLGHSADLEEWPPLRDGDIVHYTVDVPASRGLRVSPRAVLFGAVCWLSRWGCLFTSFGLLGVPLAPGHGPLRPVSGVPESIFIATDGSGLHGGSWAFLAWGYFRGQWFRIGWDGMSLAATPWIRKHYDTLPPFLHSYASELVALQAAAIWCCARLDAWQTLMGSRPRSVTLVGDNVAALQVASGAGAAGGPVATATRVLWQATQGRINTFFRHVHSHVGVLANTLADALAALRLPCPLALLESPAGSAPLSDMLDDLGPLLWLVPRAQMQDGRPCFLLHSTPDAGQDGTGDTVDVQDMPAESTHGPVVGSSTAQCRRQAPSLVSLVAITANVQTMKDAPSSIFNPSGHAARRQYLLKQVSDIPCDILCIQEARSKEGRWCTGGWLSWRSGHLKGQYGCEIWVRPDLLHPALGLNDWRLIASSPRILVVTCIDPRLPLTICSAHAPHADRPASEASAFWNDLRVALLRAPSRRGVMIGIDANADFFAQDEEGDLIGSHLAVGEPGRNDMHLLELCLQLGLYAPATHAGIQVGPRWSWEHTSGARKRIDHVLFQTGPWAVSSTAQALDLDLGHSTRDHVPLRAYAQLRCPAASCITQRPRRWTPTELAQHGAGMWQQVRRQIDASSCPSQCIETLLRCYSERARSLPQRPPLQPRQPYITTSTVQSLVDLRDWRQQLRCVKKAHHICCVHVCFMLWRGHVVPTADVAARRDSGRLWAVMASQERKLSRRAHDRARRDKTRHFLHLTQAATDQWHADGKPTEAICKLRWASRKAAERRAVFAAGGYDIDAQLEEQFRAQEGGISATPGQVLQSYHKWVSCDVPPCHSAVPSLLQLESLCRRQQASKAPGPDLVLNEFWRLFPAYAGQWFWQVWVHAALSGHEPFHFKMALICALYKKGPAALPQNYRSIALMNGMAKVWHSHLRSTLGQSVLHGYDPLQLGGRRGIPVGFAVAAYRCAAELSHLAGRSLAVLFVDVQAAYYEASRTLVFQGGELDSPAAGLEVAHLGALASNLLRSGALERLGVPESERSLLADCVACSHWRLVTSERLYVATRGSRPGDGLADIIFGALFSIALQHIRRTCTLEGLGHYGSGEATGCSNDLLQLGWADDLAVLTDFANPLELQARFPQVASIVVSTLQALKFRVNLGAGKTEALLEIRGPQAKRVRGELLTGDSAISLAPGITLRLTPEYRYLGVVQTPRDTGRRDIELCANRACGAWAHGRNLLASPSLPWALKLAWMSGRVLPAAYATLATSIAVSARAWSPLTGFYERAARTIVGSWQFGHILTGPLLGAVLGLTTPESPSMLLSSPAAGWLFK